MPYIIFTGKDCSRCEHAKKEVDAYVEHDAKYHSQPHEGWRDAPMEYIEFMAQLSIQNNVLPVIYDLDKGEFVQGDELEELVGKCLDGVCKL